MVEPNPMVACVIARGVEVLGIGHHRAFGGLHAEREALASCRARGADPRGAVMYVTLEPCNGHGKQPPCTQAIMEAGIARVVYAVRDPNPGKSGGAELLRAAGIAVEQLKGHGLAERLSAGFIKKLGSGLPWVIAKWAQTIDGRIATRTGESQWISCEASRRRVHRLRARVDVVLTGIGTVLADDPLLTARRESGARRLRRVARRVVIDSKLMTPASCRLLATVGEAPVTVVTASPPESVIAEVGESWRRRRAGITAAGADVIEVGDRGDGEVDLRAALGALAERYGVSTVLVEAGPRLLGSLVSESLVDEAIVYVAPMMLADEQARGVAAGKAAPRLAEASRWRWARSRRSGEDLELWCSRG